MNEQEFDLSIRADAYNPQELQTLSVIGSHEEEIISRLQSSAPLLLEGIRGSGKTTLLKLAAERTNSVPTSRNCVAAYLSFSRYLLLENPRIAVGPNHPFTLWVCIKMLSAVYDAARSITGQSPVVPSLAPFFVARFDVIIANLESTHKAASSESTFLQQMPVSVQSALASLQTPGRLKEVLLEVLNAFGFQSLNLLCDEAAQYFKPEFQPLFFNILKSIHAPNIFFKAAIYPTVTYFGADFELGHDASLVPLTRPCLAEEWMVFCHGIIKRRSKTTRPLGSLSDIFGIIGI